MHEKKELSLLLNVLESLMVKKTGTSTGKHHQNRISVVKGVWTMKENYINLLMISEMGEWVGSVEVNHRKCKYILVDLFI